MQQYELSLTNISPKVSLEAKRKALDEFLTSYHAKDDLIRFKKELPEKRSSFQDIEEELNTNNANLDKY
jgi:hypothetical protein